MILRSDTTTGKVIEVDPWQGKRALDALRMIDHYLWARALPGRAGRRVHEWNAETIRDVSTMVSRALVDDPTTPKGG
jgi:hypothetical protein